MTSLFHLIPGDISLPELAYGILLTTTFYLIYHAIYTIYLHPLSLYPGPKLAVISPIALLIWEITGKSHSRIKSLHDKYGDVVRIAPNVLVYRSPDAWKDIYGHRRKGQKAFFKDPSVYTPLPNGTNAIITANEADHIRMRRLLSHAFSDKALRKQEHLLHTYADLLVEKLHSVTSSEEDKEVDMTRWYNYTTFDLTGDIAFGEPFHCLRDSEYHWWVSIMLDAVKAASFLRIFWYFPFLVSLVKFVVPRHLLQKQAASFQLTVEKVDRRLNSSVKRGDFMSYILKHNINERAMSRAEIDANAATLVLAGSETTAALLSGCTFYLLTNRAVYIRLVEEIRSSFDKFADIELASIAALPYLNAVIQEGLRTYPPIPAMLPRLVPEGGAVINGRYVPGGTSVSISLWSTFHSATNFTDPDKFLPERWFHETTDSRFSNDRKDAYQPFSFGPRNCLGQHLANAEMRLILTKLLWSFDMELSPDCAGWIDQETYSLWSRPALKVKIRRAGRG